MNELLVQHVTSNHLETETKDCQIFTILSRGRKVGWKQRNKRCTPEFFPTEARSAGAHPRHGPGQEEEGKGDGLSLHWLLA